MSVTKDTKTNKWMAQIRVKDWTGKETPCAVQIALKRIRAEKGL